MYNPVKCKGVTGKKTRAPERSTRSFIANTQEMARY